MVHDLQIDVVATYDDATSITITQACKFIRGRRGHVALGVARRFANPKRGCRPLGPNGPVIFLPCVRIAGELRTMPAWVEAFEKARVAYGAPRPAPAVPVYRQFRGTRERERSFKAAEKYLDSVGIK